MDTAFFLVFLICAKMIFNIFICKGTPVVLKTIDNKNKEISTLKELLSKSSSVAQKKLISQDLKAIDNGYKSEKDNAYYLDFAFKDSERNMILHDIRIEHKGRVAQFDHILVSAIGITILESKSSTGVITINKDDSLSIKYNNTVKDLPNPVEQNRRHKVVLEAFLKDKINFSSRFKLMGGIRIEHKVLIHPKTTVSNKKLPKNFDRSDSFVTKRGKEIDAMNSVRVLLTATTILTKENTKEISQALIDAHTPIVFDYRQKYKIKQSNNPPTTKKLSSPSKKKVINTKKITKTADKEILCPRCKEGTLVKRKRKSKKYGEKYQSDEFYGCGRFPKCKYTQEI